MKIFETDVKLGNPLEIAGLTVFPLTGLKSDGPAYITGPEAFDAGLIEVSELDPPQVPWLAITNLAAVPILLVEGEMLVGGDQNRTMNVTVLCPPQARTVVPVSCVEAGRWGARRKMSASKKHAPGSLRTAKIEGLEPRTNEVSNRRSDQHLVWNEVERQSIAHSVHSETSALDDVQEEIENRIAEQLDLIKSLPDQIGVVCTIGDRVVGLDLFDKATTLDSYLREIVAGHALDTLLQSSGTDPVTTIERFLAHIEIAERDIGSGVGLGEEVLLRGEVTGIGLFYENRFVHLAAFPKRAVTVGDQ